MRYGLLCAAVLSITLCLSADLAKAGRVKKVMEYIRSKTVQEESYKFGTECEFVLQDDRTLLLKCTDNVDGIGEILVCLTKHISDSQSIYIYCDGKQGVRGGSSGLEFSDGAFRVVGQCAVAAEWSKETQGLRLKFILTDDHKTLTQKFREFLKQGRFSSSGNWENIVNQDGLKLSSDERTEIFVRLWAEVKYNFVNFDLVPEVHWDNVLKETLPLVRQDQSNKDFAKLLTRCIAGLKDGHTSISMWPYSIFDSAQPALVVRPIEGKAIITEIGESEDIARAGLKPGDEILKIDGKEIKQVLEKEIYPYIFASTDQWRNNQAYRYLLSGREDSEVKLCIQDVESKQSDIVLTRILDWRKKLPQKKNVDFEYNNIGEEISYVAINTFDSADVVDQFKGHMDKIRRSRGLIIDVRKNEGGNSSNGDRIVSLLIHKPVSGPRWKTPQYIAVIKAWGKPQNWYSGESEVIEPSDEMERFKGPVVVLTSAETFSAAEDFLVLLHSGKRAILVGGKTGGSTGQPLEFKFDYRVCGKICTKRDTYPDGREFVGIGIVPDVEVYPTQAAVSMGRDIVLERGIEVLKDCIAGRK